ncbi:MAG TPA: M20/M25/M40 family metallo-hydrolase [Solirubrobacteraceae bacterium]|nr:M20/M25/M40 family metallo-hydrolase [Solirubrobacteraceae bacterium]
MTDARPAPVASELERRHLNAIFAELCRIESPPRHERACAERVIDELRALEVQVEEDGAGALTGSDCGNLHAFVAGGAPDAERRSLLLCAHLDTVPLQAPIEPVLVEGHWENANDGVLGADNKAAVAVLIALARHVHHAGAPADLELLFTVGEETALAGARVLDVSRLRSDFGYVFDHASPIGEVVTSSPSHFRVEASFRGAAAHAGIRPEDGRSAIVAAAGAIAAMPHGRLDDETTVNVGTIAGGSAMNVVPELCTMVAEVRSIDDERARSVVAEVVDRIQEAANLPECDVDVDVSVERSFAGFRLSSGMPALKLAEASLRACGFEPVRIASGGASDANALLANGFQMVNLANGTERNHEPGERVSVAALEQMLDVALTLLHESAALSR